jgi:dTDP-4-amino-4,6-dideoxygalactose transaminase
MNEKDDFEKIIAKINNRSYGIACTHPNYVALLSAMSQKNKKRLQPGQEVVLSTIGTTLQDVLQLGLVPVFADVDLSTYNANPCVVEEAVNENTGAIFLQHTLGNPIAIQYISDRILEGSYIWGIFDCGASIGGTCTGTYDGQPIGNFGDLSTFFFKNMGIVLTDSIHLQEIAKKSCHGRCCIESIPSNIKAHRANWDYYHKAFKSELSEYFVLPEPHHLADPNWQGFCVLYHGIREKLLQYLHKKGVPTHLLPVQNYRGYKLVDTDKNTKIVKNKAFWINIGKTVTPELREYTIDTIKKGCKDAA